MLKKASFLSDARFILMSYRIQNDKKFTSHYNIELTYIFYHNTFFIIIKIEEKNKKYR